MTYKKSVTDTVKEKRSAATAADFYSGTKAMREANQIAVSESSSGQRWKTKRMDEYVFESTCRAGSETCGSSESEDVKRKLLFPCLDRNDP